MIRIPSRIVAIGAALLAVILLGTAAWAYWQAGGRGAGAASSTASTQQVTLSAATPTTRLYPGGQSAVEVTVTNPNPVPLRIESLSLATTQGTSGFAVDAAHADCGVSSLTFTTQTNGGNGWTVAASTSTAISLPSSLAMDTGAANACQGAAITVYLKSGVS